MTERPLAGVGVLVTRPEHQAGELVAAIEQQGGIAIRFPTLQIRARDGTAVAAAAARLPSPDIVIFVSSNAVRYGIHEAGDARIAVIGPATAAAVTAAGRRVDIAAAEGFDSDQLLATDELRTVAGRTITIMRGQDGRELLANTLRKRGAEVNYLTVYERSAAVHTSDEIQTLLARWRAGEIRVVTALSVDTFEQLVAQLPVAARPLLASTPLVTPAARVLKHAGNLIPDLPVYLADGPDAAAMVRAIVKIASGKSK